MKVIAIIVAIFLIGILILGYGFNNALKAKNYGKEVSDIVIDTLKTFSNIKGSAAPSQTRAAFATVSETAKKNTQKVEQINTPKGTETLRSDTVQLLQLASDISTRGEAIFDYIITLQESTKLIQTKLAKPKDIKGVESQLSSLKSKIDKELNKLTTSTPPPSLSKFHLDLVDAFSKTSKKLGQILVSINKKEFSTAQDQLEELSGIAGSFSKISIPSESQLISAILPKEEQAKLESLSGRIDSENAKLQKTFFIF